MVLDVFTVLFLDSVEELGKFIKVPFRLLCDVEVFLLFGICLEIKKLDFLTIKIDARSIYDKVLDSMLDVINFSNGQFLIIVEHSGCLSSMFGSIIILVDLWRCGFIVLCIEVRKEPFDKLFVIGVIKSALVFLLVSEKTDHLRII